MYHKIIRDYLLQFVGTPYIWGGDDPINGFDCSGFAQEYLASFGKDPPGDQTANSLYRYFLKHGEIKKHCDLGYLLFFGDKERIKHVAIGLTADLMIEAGGGTSVTRTINDAIIQNAYIRIRPHNSRNDLVVILDPLF